MASNQRRPAALAHSLRSASDHHRPQAEVLEIRPADFTQDTLLAARNFEAAFQKIRNGGGGVHGSSMPAWGVMLSDGDIWYLVAYIGAFRAGVLSPPPSG